MASVDELAQLLHAASQRDRRGRSGAKQRAALHRAIAGSLAALGRRDRDALVVCAAIGDAWDVHPVLPALDQLLAAGASPDARTDAHRVYPYPSGVPVVHALMRALRNPARKSNRHIEAAAIALVGAGAKLGGFGPMKLALIHHAAECGLVKLIDALVARGADVDVRDKAGETPLLHAARGDQVAAAQTLIRAGATNATNRHRETAYEIAVAFASRRMQRFLASRFPPSAMPSPRARPAVRPGDVTITDADIARLLARLAATRRRIVAPSGAPDPIARSLFRGGTVAAGRVTIKLDTTKLPKLSPTVRAQLLLALGQEALRWLDTSRVEARGYAVGGVAPWFMITAKSAPRARKLLLTLRPGR